MQNAVDQTVSDGLERLCKSRERFISAAPLPGIERMEALFLAICLRHTGTIPMHWV